jgi:hypothetical protein
MRLGLSQLTRARTSTHVLKPPSLCIAGLANSKNLTRSEKFLAEIGLRTS